MLQFSTRTVWLCTVRDGIFRGDENEEVFNPVESQRSSMDEIYSHVDHPLSILHKPAVRRLAQQGPGSWLIEILRTACGIGFKT